MRGALLRLAGAFAVAAVWLGSCKEAVSPHVAAEGDPEMLVAQLEPGGAASAAAYGSAGAPTIFLTLNNAPGGDRPLEQEILQREVNLFEQRNPGIRIQFSPWVFSPESLHERARNRTLTDIIEVWASQMQPIIDHSYAADITDHCATAKELRYVNKGVMQIVSRNGRVYGVPSELHTLALFYNRRLLKEASGPKPATKPAKAESSKAKGGGGEPRDFLEDSDGDGRRDFQVAQLFGFNWGQQDDDDSQRGYNRRGEDTVRDYYNLPSRRQGRQRRQDSYYDYGQQQGYYQQQTPSPRRQVTPVPRPLADDGGPGIPESARPGSKRRSIQDDIISPSAEAALTSSAAAAREEATTIVQTAGLPQDWEGLIQLAVRITDHDAHRYGFAPHLFAREGGREFCQWAMQNGLQIEVPSGNTATLDINTSAAAEVAQFMKEMTWRYDVTPPVDKCYGDNLMRMFANGQVAMMILPATGETFDRLSKLGMSFEDLGVAALPQGPRTRAHLTFGRCLIVNSQLDREHRAAAFKWLMFQLDPERILMRERFYFQEQEITGVPAVPLFIPGRQKQLHELLKPFRTLPVYADYESVVASHLRPEPPYFADKLYDAIATGIRPIVEQPDSKPEQSIALLGAEFEAAHLRNAPTREGLDRYLRMLTQR